MSDPPLPPLPPLTPATGLTTSPRKGPSSPRSQNRPAPPSLSSSLRSVPVVPVSVGPPSPRGGGGGGGTQRPAPPSDSALLDLMMSSTTRRAQQPQHSPQEPPSPRRAKSAYLSESQDSVAGRRPVSPRADERAKSPPVSPRAAPAVMPPAVSPRGVPTATTRPAASQPTVVVHGRTQTEAPAMMAPPAPIAAASAAAPVTHGRTQTEAPPMAAPPAPKKVAALAPSENEWLLEETPNGLLSVSGLSLVKQSPEKKWDCDTRGTEGWTKGVHQWSVRLDAGGNGVGLGISLGEISKTDDSLNSNVSFIINCTTGAAYDDAGNKTPVFAVPSGGMPAASVVTVRLNLEDQSVSFGWNGKGLDKPTFCDIPRDCWYPFFAIGVCQKSISVIRGAEIGVAIAAVTPSVSLRALPVPRLALSPRAAGTETAALPPVPVAAQSAREQELRAMSLVIGEKERAEIAQESAILAAREKEEEKEEEEEEENDSTPDVEDMMRLDMLTERSIARNFRKRFDSGKIYTFVGDVVCSVNPYRSMPELYTTKIMQNYLSGNGSMAPHVFFSAAAAFKGLSEGNQTILATGESGSGKTEATRLIVQWLSFAGQDGGAGGGQSVNSLMVLSSVILEAFGNAQTVRNCNSSRFGKLFQISFNDEKRVESCSVTTFLLEVSRVTSQSAGERNFHAFYRMLRGAHTTRSQFSLKGGPESYRYTRTCTLLATQEFDDVEEWTKLCRALKAFQIDAGALFSVLSGILWLGEIDFALGPAERDKNNPNILLPAPIVIQNPEAVETAARLLGIDAARLAACFERRTVQADNRATFAHVTLTVKESEEARDSLARAVYSKLFDWLVAQINSRVAGRNAANRRFIALLDMFGFENFPVNSFSQLLINYSNEELQRLFAQRIFCAEQEQYAAEGVQWKPVAYPDNSACLKFVEETLSLLDEDSKLVMGSDTNWLEKIQQTRHPNLLPQRFKGGAKQFAVNHYAGPVVYDVAGFRSQNLFVLRPELSSVMLESQLPLVAGWFQEAPQSSKKGTRAAATVSRSHRTQLADLSRIICQTSQHFVRCIRPNSEQRPYVFDRNVVERQLASLGLLATCQIRKAALPFRFGVVEFHERYWQLVGEQAFTATEAQAKAKAAATATKLCKLTSVSGGFAVGNSRVFLSSDLYDACEKLRNDMLADLEKMRLEKEARAKAAEEQRLKDEKARHLAEQKRLEDERKKRELAEREQARLQKEREEEEKRKQAEKEGEAIRAQQERAALEKQRQVEFQRQEELRIKAEQERLRKEEEEERLRAALANEAEEEAARQKALQAERDARKRAAEEQARAVQAEEDAARSRKEEERIRELQEEDRKRRMMSDLLAARNAAKGFVRPMPIAPESDWTVNVVGHESRKAKKSEQWIKLSVLCGREQWHVVKSPACLTELRERLQLVMNESGKKAALPPISTKESVAMSFFGFCLTDPLLHSAPALRQFLRAGLANCEEASSWLEGGACSGTLVKKKGESKGLKKKEATRHCVIKNRILYYSARPEDVNPRGLITLDGSIVAVMQQHSAKEQGDKARPASPRKGIQQFRLLQHDGSSYLFSGAAALCTQFVDTVVAGNKEVKEIVSREESARVLEVEIIGARDLIVFDANPFCIAYIDNQQIETRAAHGANPMWREVYREESEPIPSVLARGESLLWLTVWSKPVSGGRGLLRHQFLGMAVVTVSALPSVGTTDVWIPLVPRTAKEKVSGAVRVALTFRGNDQLAGKLEVAPYVGTSLDRLMHGVTLPLPVLIAQLLAYFVRNKTTASDAEFFQLPYGPEFCAFVAEVNACAETTQQFVIGADADPSHLIGLLFLALRSLATPVISFRVFQTLFGTVEGEDSSEVRVAAVVAAIAQMDEVSRTVLGYTVAVLRLLVANSPGNATETVRFGKVVARRGGRAQIRRRVRDGEGVTTADVISSFGCVLARPPMETERTVLRLIETNQVLEYVLSHARELFPKVDLDGLVKAVDAMEARGGASFVFALEGLGAAPLPPGGSTTPRKPLPLPEFDDSVILPETEEGVAKPLPVPDSDSDDTTGDDE